MPAAAPVAIPVERRARQYRARIIWPSYGLSVAEFFALIDLNYLISLDINNRKDYRHKCYQ